jgi:anti-sigma B factor antagonist
MEITTRDYKRLVVIRVTGRVDANTAPEFESKLNEHIRSGHHKLVLETDGTDYMSSAAVRALISAQKALKGRGGGVVLAQPSERVKEIIRIAGMESLFPIYETTEAAIGSE